MLIKGRWEGAVYGDRGPRAHVEESRQANPEAMVTGSESDTREPVADEGGD